MTLVNIAQLDRPDDGIEGLPRVIASSIGREINDVYRNNNVGVLDNVELNTKIVEASRAAVRALVEQSTNEEGTSSRIKWDFFTTSVTGSHLFGLLAPVYLGNMS